MGLAFEAKFSWKFFGEMSLQINFSMLDDGSIFADFSLLQHVSTFKIGSVEKMKNTTIN